MIEFLLENGAELEKMNKVYRYLFEKAKYRLEILKLLIKYDQLDISARDGDNSNILHIFLRGLDIAFENSCNVVETVEVLLNSGISIAEETVYGITPLFNAIDRRLNELVIFLVVNKKVDVNKKNIEETLFPLQVAAECNNVELIEFFLSNGAEINATNKHGTTALHSACNWRNKKSISLLMQKGADISMEDDEGFTPFSLIRPGRRGSHDICKIMFTTEMAKLKFQNSLVSQKDVDSIQNDPRTREQYEKCLFELDQMSKTIFYAPYSYYSVLKMSKNIKKLAYLAKNNEFVVAFKANLISFSHYKDDLRRIFKKAVQLRDECVTIYRIQIEIHICRALAGSCSKNIGR